MHFNPLVNHGPAFGYSFCAFEFGITIPLSYILTVHCDMSIYAIWGAVIAGNVIPSVLGYFWIRGKLWKMDFSTDESELETETLIAQ